MYVRLKKIRIAKNSTKILICDSPLEDLTRLNKLIKDQVFVEEEMLEIMGKLVAVKEFIEILETSFLNKK